MVEVTKLMIATPAYGGQVYSTYHDSIVRLIKIFGKKYPNLEIDNQTISLAMITMSRNLYASMVLNNKDYSHLLFIDADVGFSPETVEQMIMFDKPIVAASYPYKRFDIEAYHNVRSKITDPVQASLCAQDYVSKISMAYVQGADKNNTNFKSSDMTWKGSFLRVVGAATGMMLIKREVLETLCEKFPELYLKDGHKTYADIGCNGPILQCFECLQGEDGVFLSEDISFSMRWTKHCGGEMWLQTNADLSHTGNCTFKGNYATKLKAGYYP